MLTVQMSERDKSELKKDAYQHGMNVSEYIRWLIREEKYRKQENK